MKIIIAFLLFADGYAPTEKRRRISGPTTLIKVGAGVQGGSKLIRQYKYSDAEKKLDKILKNIPTFTRRLYARQVAYYDMGLPAKAMPLFDAVIQAAPDYDPEMYHAAAINALAMKDDASAVQHYTTLTLKRKCR